MSFAMTMLLKPFITLLIFVVIVWPIKAVFVRFFPEGKIKRLLLRPISKQ